MSSKCMKAGVFTAVAVLLSLASIAQYYKYNENYYDKDVIWEIGTSLGLMNSLTDVGRSGGLLSNLSMKTAQVNGSFYVGIMYQNMVGGRIEATWGMISGADSNGTYKPRNLSFRSPITEIALIGELHPLTIFSAEVPRFSPYIAAGMGWFSFNPQAKLGNSWVDLRPLRTEGQGFPQTASLVKDTRPYNLSQVNIIIGTGVKYELTPIITLRAEFLYRKTFTDYLDDVSTVYIDPDWFDQNLPPFQAAQAKQLYDRTYEIDPGAINDIGQPRGSRNKDAYYTFNLKLAVSLGRTRIN